MKNVYLLPWKDISEIYGYPRFMRPRLGELNDFSYHALVWKPAAKNLANGMKENLWQVWTDIKGYQENWDTKEDAIKAAEITLLENGYRFIAAEDAEKFMVLL